MANNYDVEADLSCKTEAAYDRTLWLFLFEFQLKVLVGGLNGCKLQMNSMVTDDLRRGNKRCELSSLEA